MDNVDEKAALESSKGLIRAMRHIPDGEMFINDTPPPLGAVSARRQAATPDPRSQLGAAAEVGPALAGAGTIP